MDFYLTKEQEMIRKMASEFAARYCEPEAAAVDETHEFPIETWKLMQRYGLLRINHSERYGGTGIDPIAEMIVIEELSKASLTHGAMYALLANGFPTFIELFGTEDQKQEFIPEVLENGAIGAFDMTEPDAGSDASGVHTTSVRDGDDYIINGTKCFITAGNIAKYHLVVCMADAKSGEKGFNGFIINGDAPGVSIGKIENKMGIRGLPTAEVAFEDVRVPKERMLGGEAGIGKMMHFALGTLDAARVGTGAQALGVASAAFEKGGYVYSQNRTAIVSGNVKGRFSLSIAGIILGAASLLLGVKCQWNIVSMIIIAALSVLTPSILKTEWNRKRSFSVIGMIAAIVLVLLAIYLIFQLYGALL